MDRGPFQSTLLSNTTLSYTCTPKLTVTISKCYPNPWSACMVSSGPFWPTFYHYELPEVSITGGISTSVNWYRVAMAVSKGYLSTTLSAQTTNTRIWQACVRLLPEVSIIGGIATSVNWYRAAMAVSKGCLITALSAQTTGKPTHSRQVCVRLLPEVYIIGGIAWSHKRTQISSNWRLMWNLFCVSCMRPCENLDAWRNGSSVQAKTVLNCNYA